MGTESTQLVMGSFRIKDKHATKNYQIHVQNDKTINEKDKIEQMNFDLTKVYRSRKTLDTINALREMGENIAYTTKNEPYTQEIKVVTAEIKKRTG